MKPTDYIEWDNLKDIPFFLCQVVEDREKQDLDIYYLGKRVLHDYGPCGALFADCRYLVPQGKEPHSRLGKPA